MTTGLKYNEDHLWVLLQGDTATVGISQYAAEQLGDLVFADLPETCTDCNAGDSIAALESVKSASDIHAPCGGKVIATNDKLGDDPELINREPESGGWLFKLQVSDQAQLDSLMDPTAYQAFTAK